MQKFKLASTNVMKNAAALATGSDIAQINNNLLLPENFPVAPAQQTLVFGCATVAFLVAHTVELAKQDLLGQEIFFTGGFTVAHAEPELAALAEQAGFPAPFKAETQAEYGCRVFIEQMEAASIDLPRRIVVEHSRSSRNTAENLREGIRDRFMRTETGDPIAAVNIVCQAYHPLRAGGTVMRLATEEEQLDPRFKTPTIIPHGVWLQAGNVDVNRNNWHEQPDFVCGPFFAELARLTTGLNGEPNHYDQGHCLKINRDKWHEEIENYAATAPVTGPLRPGTRSSGLKVLAA